MATISFTDEAPKFDGSAHFVFGNAEFDLEAGASFETEDPTIVSCAYTHPWLKVEVPVVDVKAASDWDENDPHDNPSIDHLSSLASPESKAAADAAEAAVLAEAYPDGFPGANNISQQDIDASGVPAPVVETQEAPVETETEPVVTPAPEPAPAAPAPASGGSA